MAELFLFNLAEAQAREAPPIIIAFGPKQEKELNSYLTEHVPPLQMPGFCSICGEPSSDRTLRQQATHRYRIRHTFEHAVSARELSLNPKQPFEGSETIDWPLCGACGEHLDRNVELLRMVTPLVERAERLSGPMGWLLRKKRDETRRDIQQRLDGIQAEWSGGTQWLPPHAGIVTRLSWRGAFILSAKRPADCEHSPLSVERVYTSRSASEAFAAQFSETNASRWTTYQPKVKGDDRAGALEELAGRLPQYHWLA